LIKIEITSVADADSVTAEELIDNDTGTIDDDNRTDYNKDIDKGGENGAKEADFDFIKKGINRRRV
jgi:hypothetical protein